MISNLEIRDKPNDLKLESIKSGELYPKLILELEITSAKDFLILESNANLLFMKEGSNESIEVYCEPYENYIGRSTRYFKFYTYFTPDLFQTIETFRAGENLKININIGKIYLLNFKRIGTFNPIQGSKTEIQKGEISTENFLIVQRPAYKQNQEFLNITREQWSDKVLKPYNTMNRFIIELPYQFPDVSTQNVNKSELDDLKDRVIRGITLLRKITEEYNMRRDSEKCVDRIREVTDLLHNIPNKKSLYKIYGEYLIEKTFTGSDNISEEIIANIFNIIDALFNISSKGPHAVTKGRVIMEYYPKYEDGDILLGITTFIYYFLSKKFERYFALK